MRRRSTWGWLSKDRSSRSGTGTSRGGRGGGAGEIPLELTGARSAMVSSDRFGRAPAAQLGLCPTEAGKAGIGADGRSPPLNSHEREVERRRDGNVRRRLALWRIARETECDGGGGASGRVRPPLFGTVI